MTRYLKVIEKVTGISLCMHPANERQRYIVTSSPTGWSQTQNDPWSQICWGPVSDQLGTVSVTSWGQFYKWWLTPINIMFREWHHTQLSIIKERKNQPGTPIFHSQLLHGIVHFFHKFQDDIWNPSRVTQWCCHWDLVQAHHGLENFKVPYNKKKFVKHCHFIKWPASRYCALSYQIMGQYLKSFKSQGSMDGGWA